ncbi:MarR family winged helix-turn-helix transcriptional regulator [Actinomadura roseirufa]|uniref:MarR family winged helix-turn-helix transcriptional regulator n=1 Tax=Actinomadura roseirufa TaxID=2094049 RepID=UPI00104107DB|nr:winged helix DNA-binding protein [Actinomadura roseirufa]
MRPVEEFRYLVLAAQREGNRLLGQALKPLGVTTAQAEVIRVLQDRQPLTLNGLGDLLVCESGNSPSRLVERLVAAGHLHRATSPADRRHIELTLTPQGTALARQITEIEERLYVLIETMTQGGDLTPINAFLRAFVADFPAGQALARRTTP